MTTNQPDPNANNAKPKKQKSHSEGATLGTDYVLQTLKQELKTLEEELEAERQNFLNQANKVKALDECKATIKKIQNYRDGASRATEFELLRLHQLQEAIANLRSTGSKVPDMSMILGTPLSPAALPAQHYNPPVQPSLSPLPPTAPQPLAQHQPFIERSTFTAIHKLAIGFLALLTAGAIAVLHTAKVGKPTFAEPVSSEQRIPESNAFSPDTDDFNR